MFYIDTANKKEIEKYNKLHFLKGVTTNPTILSKTELESDYITHSKAVIQDNKNLMYYLQLTGETAKEMLAHYKLIKEKFGDEIKNVGIKVPMTMAGFETVRYIKKDNPKQKIMGTSMYSIDQGILSAAVGCDAIVLYINRMEMNNIDSLFVVESIRKYVDDHNLDMEIVGASYKNTGQVVNSLVAGVHSATIAPDIFEKMIQKDLSVKALKDFNEDAKKYK